MMTMHHVQAHFQKPIRFIRVLDFGARQSFVAVDCSTWLQLVFPFPHARFNLRDLINILLTPFSQSCTLRVIVSSHRFMAQAQSGL